MNREKKRLTWDCSDSEEEEEKEEENEWGKKKEKGTSMQVRGKNANGVAGQIWELGSE